MTEKKPAQRDPEAASHKIEIYKLYVDLADRVSERRQKANSFYLSVNTLLVGGSAYLKDTQTLLESLLITVAGLAICALWLMNSWSYKTLSHAKWDVVQETEKELPLQPFTDEWKKLDPDQDGIRHRPFHKVERVVPWIFMAVYVVQGLRKLPWADILKLMGFC